MIFLPSLFSSNTHLCQTSVYVSYYCLSWDWSLLFLFSHHSCHTQKSTSILGINQEMQKSLLFYWHENSIFRFLFLSFFPIFSENFLNKSNFLIFFPCASNQSWACLPMLSTVPKCKCFTSFPHREKRIQRAKFKSKAFECLMQLSFLNEK